MRYSLSLKQAMSKCVGEIRWRKETRFSPSCGRSFLLSNLALVRVYHCCRGTQEERLSNVRLVMKRKFTHWEGIGV